jgi:hypothetical protein
MAKGRANINRAAFRMVIILEAAQIQPHLFSILPIWVVTGFTKPSIINPHFYVIETNPEPGCRDVAGRGVFCYSCPEKFSSHFGPGLGDGEFFLVFIPKSPNPG